MKNIKKSISFFFLMVAITILPISSLASEDVNKREIGIAATNKINIGLLGEVEVPKEVSFFIASQSEMMKHQKANASEMDIMSRIIFDGLGKDYEIYQIKGQNADGRHTALMFSLLVSDKEVTKHFKEPISEKTYFEITSFNNNLLTLEKKVNAFLMKQKLSNSKMPVITVKLLDLKLIEKMSTKKTIYKTAFRGIINIDGFQLTSYITAYAFEKEGKASLNFIMTSDVERNYLTPIFDKIFINM